MNALKVLTWSVSEPRKQTPIWVVEAILDELDTDSFEDVQFANLMLDLWTNWQSSKIARLP